MVLTIKNIFSEFNRLEVFWVLYLTFCHFNVSLLVKFLWSLGPFYTIPWLDSFVDILKSSLLRKLVINPPSWLFLTTEQLKSTIPNYIFLK